MLQIVHIYAVRNDLIHASFIPLIKNGLFDDLKKQLHHHFYDSPFVIADVEKPQTKLIMSLLETITDNWFDRDQEDPDIYQMWAPMEQLRDCYKSLRGSNP